jgi:hypothetical protein
VAPRKSRDALGRVSGLPVSGLLVSAHLVSAHLVSGHYATFSRVVP